MQRKLEAAHQGSLVEGRRHGKIEDSKRLCSDEWRVVS